MEHYDSIHVSKRDQALLNQATKNSLLVGIILLIIKFYAYRLTNSLAIYSDALESIVNVVTAAITIFVVWYASQPADEDHPYGHGKVESIAASFEGGAIGFAGVMIILDALNHLFLEKKSLQDLDLGGGLVLFAGLINGAYGLWVLNKGKSLHSEALKATGHHLISDMLTSLGVLLGLFLVKITGIMLLDSLLALAFGGYLVYTGVKIFARSVDILVDAQDKELVIRLAGLFEKNKSEGVIHIHHTRVMRSGHHHHIDCHLVIPEFWSVEKAHDFSDEFEKLVLKDYEVEGEFHYHLDPCRKKYCKNCSYEPCAVRQVPFEKRIELTYDELIKRN